MGGVCLRPETYPTTGHSQSDETGFPSLKYLIIHYSRIYSVPFLQISISYESETMFFVFVNVTLEPKEESVVGPEFSIVSKLNSRTQSDWHISTVLPSF
jgi:hypothetical protein